MSIFIHENSQTFHLQNESISYIMTVLPGGQLGQLYFGARIRDREDFSHLLEGCIRSHSAVIADDGSGISPEHLRLEYPVYGSADFREGAVEVLQENGSRLAEFVYSGYEILPGKPRLEGLPATYVESGDEAETLCITLEDEEAHLTLELLYTIFRKESAIARSARIISHVDSAVTLTRAMSLSLDLPDADYDWMQFSGSWARERHPAEHRLHMGVQSVGSLRGHSSHQHNPFVILKRPNATERSGEVVGVSLLYSGNFLMRAEVDTYGVTRLQAGIHPTWFAWRLASGESFQTPEALLVWSESGMNGMSQTFHRICREHLTRGIWKRRPRPILINNWEATFFDFDEAKLLRIAETAKTCGVEMFVLDDGWFGGRRSDHAGLGDWTPATELLPDGITGLAEKVRAMGLKFGLWIEPEMVNPDSDLYRAHPDWILHIPGRRESLSRHQCVLDFSRPEVVDHIHGMIAAILRDAPVSYIKWDMNRSITEAFSEALPAEREGEVFHRYILGVYDLYERLITEFPEVLFESCAGGGGRFDMGLLYYAPQAWTSDNTDAIERICIQYGTSYGYPVSSMGSHVSAVPNAQVRRMTPLKTRADVAYFGTYGYELDLGLLSEEELTEVRAYTQFMKDHRALLQFGTFYRLRSPFEGDKNGAAWMVVSEDKRTAIVGNYRILCHANEPFSRLRLDGLDPDLLYAVEGGGEHYGDELMRVGLITSGDSTGKTGENVTPTGDFQSEIYVLRAKETA